jgi:hypothetical protein
MSLCDKLHDAGVDFSTVAEVISRITSVDFATARRIAENTAKKPMTSVQFAQALEDHESRLYGLHAALLGMEEEDFSGNFAGGVLMLMRDIQDEAKRIGEAYEQIRKATPKKAA